MSQDRSERFSRQTRFAELGCAGQSLLRQGRVAVVGCGATGGGAAALLARAGVGHLRLCDRDLVEISNLPRQLLFTEADLDPPRAKAEAAARALQALDADLRVEPWVVDVTPATVRQVIDDVDLVLDGTDSFETRYLLNDACIEAGRPWIHMGAVGAVGQTLTIWPGTTACLACLWPTAPVAAEQPRCDTHGVLGPAAVAVASLAAGAALKVLAGVPDPARGRLLTIDVWEGKSCSLPVPRRPDCRACARQDLVFLRGQAHREAMPLCGREAVQLSPAGGPTDLAGVARTLTRLASLERGSLQVQVTPHLVTAREGALTLHHFSDGRVIVQGTADPVEARSFLLRLVGG